MIAHVNEISHNNNINSNNTRQGCCLSGRWSVIRLEKEVKRRHQERIIVMMNEQERRSYNTTTTRTHTTTKTPSLSSDIVAGQDLPANLTDSGQSKMLPKLGLDLLSCKKVDDKIDSSVQVFYANGRLETDTGESLDHVISSIQSARDRHEQNIELIRDKNDQNTFSVRTLRSIREGQPLLIWYGESLARELGIPVLTPSNIRGHQEYTCTTCHSKFAQPNVLKAHLFYECIQDNHQNCHQSNLVPFHALLEKISTCFISSKGNSSPECKEKEPNQCYKRETSSPDTEIVCSQTNVDGNSKTDPLTLSIKSECEQKPQLLRCFPMYKTAINDKNDVAESNQNQLSPSSSSSTSSSSSSSSLESFVDEIEDRDTVTEGIRHDPEQEHQRHHHHHHHHRHRRQHHQPRQHRRHGENQHRTRSAFHRPTPSSKRGRTSDDITTQTPDSSTDQRSALNLSVKSDHSLFGYAAEHHKNLLTQSLNNHHHHPWSISHNSTCTTKPPPVPYSLHCNAIPIYYPLNHNTIPQAVPLSINYDIAYNNHNHRHTHQILPPRRPFPINGQCLDTNINIHNAEYPLQTPISPKRDHQGIPTMSFSSTENSLPSDGSTSPINPYGINLPSDQEPLDLLPQTYFTNKSKRGHLCLYCGKLYSRKYGLKIHMRTHNGYKPLKCKICSRPFGDPSNLNKHVRLHAQGDTPYRCEYCGKVLVRRRDLERHVRSRHPMGNLPVESSPPSSPISIEEVDTSCHDNVPVL